MISPLNPSSFTNGEMIESVYSKKIYTVIEANKKGMAKLKNQHGYIETFNACNNPHFIKFKGQFRLF